MAWFDLLMRHLFASHVFALTFVVFMADSDNCAALVSVWFKRKCGDMIIMNFLE